MMWSVSRSEVTEMHELSELSEPGGGAGTPVVWRTLCLCVYAGHFWCVWDSKMKGARTWHLVNLPEQDAEVVIILWFKNNKTLTMSCVLCPI